MFRQLALKVRLSDHASFDNFYPGSNREAVAATRELATTRPGLLFLHGLSGTGKTHLLYAAVKEADACNRPAFYTSRKVANSGTGEWLDLPGDGLICVDDIGERLSPREGTALFTLYERIRSQAGSLVVGSRLPPLGVHWVLPDLRSRVQSDLVYPMSVLTEAELEEALRFRASQRGFHLSDTVMRFVLRRYERSPVSLFQLLERIDLESLSRKRRITVPFLRSLEADIEDPVQ
ncbi:MAG: DnaA regulatory inactivator Hda [Gammaproteobacteria bacterium]|nr:DnaA regulatory inactivator Hda [Gammaproteobacteria bacterium]